MLKNKILISDNDNLSNEEILLLHDEISFFANTQTNDFYSNFNCAFIKNYMLNNLYERKFSYGSRIEFYDNVIMLVQGEYDYGTLYAHIFGHTEDTIIEFLKKNFTGTLGADRLTLVIVPLHAEKIKEYKAISTFEHHALLHDISFDEYVLFSKKHDCDNINHREFDYRNKCIDLKDWEQIFRTGEHHCKSPLHIGMIKVYVE